jgi:hypothetical protein
MSHVLPVTFMYDGIMVLKLRGLDNVPLTIANISTLIIFRFIPDSDVKSIGSIRE